MLDGVKTFVDQLRDRRDYLLKELKDTEETPASAEQVLGITPTPVQAVKPVALAEPPANSRVVLGAERFRERVLSVMSTKHTWMTKKAIHELMERTSSSYLKGARNRYAKVADAIDVLTKRGAVLRNGIFYGLESYHAFDSTQNIEALRRWNHESLRKKKAASLRAWDSRRGSNNHGEGVVAG